MARTEGEKGLDESGHIRREGAPERIDARFRPAIDDLSARSQAAFGPRLNGLYLYGSIPRGTARIGQSDLDAMVVLTERRDTDPTALVAIESELDDAYELVDGVGIVHATRDQLLDPAERYDGGFFVSCLCTPILGEDLGRRWAPYRPTVELARGLNANYGERLDVVRSQLLEGMDPRLVARFARKILRTAFCLVLHRWHGWTSDLDTIVEVFGAYYPERVDELRAVAALARHPKPNRDEVLAILDGIGAWLRDEYDDAVLIAPHGRR